MTAPGWYSAEGDPPGTQRYWDGTQWTSEPYVINPPPATSASPSNGPGVADGYQQPPAQPSRRVAEASDRVLGRLIDVMIVLAFVVAMLFLDLGGPGDASVIENSDLQLNINGWGLDTWVEYAIYVLFTFVWSAAWIHLKGGTPGKLMMKLRVANVATGHSPVSLTQACLRSANYLLPIVGLVSLRAGSLASAALSIVSLVSFVMLFAAKERRTVMDHIGKTVVLHK